MRLSETRDICGKALPAMMEVAVRRCGLDPRGGEPCETTG